MLYGAQIVRPLGANVIAGGEMTSTTRRAHSYVRAATIDAFYTSRAASVRPEAVGVRIHPQVAISAARFPDECCFCIIIVFGVLIHVVGPPRDPSASGPDLNFGSL